MDAAPRAKDDDPTVKAIVAIWRKIERPFAALTGRETGLVVLAPEARIGQGDEAKAFSPAAYICPGAPPLVYVPDSLIELVLRKKTYPVDFLAFVLGHELGHRANDFSSDGCQLAAFARPGKGKTEEALADRRSAFFIALAGFPTRALARADLVSAFLQQEFGVRQFNIDQRKAAVMDALDQFDAFENMYQVSIALALSGETGSATRLLAWAEDLMRSTGLPIPELLVARALVLMMHAAPDAPWLESAKLPQSAGHLRCAPIFAGHTALWEEPEPAGVVRGAAETETARRNLLTARRLLEEAGEMGASPLTVAAGQSCAAFYLGEADVARRQHELAMKALSAKAPEPVKRALAANLALVDFLSAVQSAPPAPPSTDTKAVAKWAQPLAKKRAAFRAHRQLDAYVAALADPKAVVAAPASNLPKCIGNPSAPAPLAIPAAKAPNPAKLGACPTGWKQAHTLPKADVAERTGTTTGITTCVPDDGRAGVRWSRVDLPAVTSPVLSALRIAIRMIDASAMELPPLNTWICLCGEGMSYMGVSDLGESGYMVACEPLGVSLGVLYATPDGSVSRLAVLEGE